MRDHVSVLLAEVVLLAFTSACGAKAEQTSPDLMVIGDSISAPWRYNATGSDGKIKAWWAYVADSAGVDAADASRVLVNAIPGTGMLATGPTDKHAAKNLDGLGEACGDNTPGEPNRSFGTRLDDISADHPPRVLIVEGGRNDFKACDNGITRIASAAESNQAIEHFMASLARRVRVARINAADVFVVSPWGVTYPGERTHIVDSVRAATLAHGFQWIPVPTLSAADTVDGTHPNVAGAKWLAEQIAKNSDVVARLMEAQAADG